MKKEEIHLADIARILFGNAPPEFLLEVAIRSIIMYVALVTIVRFLGKRTNSLLTITERAIFITLGAIVSQPMLGPPNGIVNGIIALCCMLVFQRMLTLTFFKSLRWQQFMQGKEHLLVKDSVIDLKELHRVDVTRNQLFELLRNREIRHLGQVKRVYLEACGTISIFPNDQVRPGLSILRTHEAENMVRKDENLKVCATCGNDNQDNETICNQCGSEHWAAPSIEYIK
jgi:uncharacterized membrane protein YcaP (DUF421 family)